MEINKNTNLSNYLRFNRSVYKPENQKYKEVCLEDSSEYNAQLNSSQNPCNPSDTKCTKITMGMLFDFMRTAYKVDNSFEGLANTLTANSEVDWNELAKTDLSLRAYSDSLSNDEHDDSLSNDEHHYSTDILKRENKSVETIDNESTEAAGQCDVNVHDVEIVAQNESIEVQQLGTEVTEMQQKKEQKADETMYSLNSKTNMFEETVNVNEQNSISKIKQVTQNEENKTALTNKNEELWQEQENALSKIMRKNLSDILHEGLLDSVLPYMIPKRVSSQPVIKKSISINDIKKSHSLNGITEKSASKEKDKSKSKKLSDSEVEIHVCDEGKNVKKDFRCPQKLLVQKMRYFADVTAEQKLEEIDISVHCDIVIFDWLMRWVKKDIIKKSDWPVLEATNVIPIMVSASFLQMEPLLESCLQFCHDNMSDILRTSTILTCLNDNLLTRLAKLFSNEDVEMLRDKKDKIQSRLFCKLIMSLAENTPENRKGHYSSLATLFKCSKCGKTIIYSIANLVPCIPSSIKIDNRGNISYKHVRDLTWNLNDYVCNLRTNLRTWRKVYWKLWSDCHFLFCRRCDTYFPVHQMDWCCYHPDAPQYFVNEQQRPTPFPLGRYPCCSQRAYKFEALPNRDGCRYKEHTPDIKTETDINIYNIFTAHKDIISIEPPQLFFPEKITRLVARDPSIRPGKIMCKEMMWWNGLELVPPRPKLGLLGKLWGGSNIRRFVHAHDAQKVHRQRSTTTEASPPSSPGNSDNEETGTVCEESSTDNDSNYSEESNAWASLSLGSKTRKKSTSQSVRKNNIRCWSNDLTTRYNQDNQRDFEEKAAVQMMTLLTKRTCADSVLLKPTKQHSQWKSQPRGGIYVKLEAEFLDRHVQSCKNKSSSKNKSFVS